MKSPTSCIVVRWRKTVLSASIYSKCLGCTTACLNWELIFQMTRSLTEYSSHLLPSYKSFLMNYNMQGIEKSIPELYSTLKSAEVEIKKEHQVLMVNKTTSFKKGKGKKNFKKDGKGVSTPSKSVARKK